VQRFVFLSALAAFISLLSPPFLPLFLDYSICPPHCQHRYLPTYLPRHRHSNQYIPSKHVFFIVADSEYLLTTATNSHPTLPTSLATRPLYTFSNPYIIKLIMIQPYAIRQEGIHANIQRHTRQPAAGLTPLGIFKMLAKAKLASRARPELSLLSTVTLHTPALPAVLCLPGISR